jgi:transposase, IS5 family
VKSSKARPPVNGKPYIDIAIPSFGYKSHIAICRGFGFIRKSVVAYGARHDGSQLREVVTANSTASDVWVDTAYRSKSNEAWLKANNRDSPIHRKKPKRKPMPDRTRKDNSIESKVRIFVKHVFALEKAHMGLLIRNIALKRTEAKIVRANLACDMKRLIFHER